MGTLSLFPTLCAPLRTHLSSSETHLSSSETHLCNPIFLPHVSVTYPQQRRFRSKNVAFGSKSVDPKESQFFDEDGAVDDMDGYMNYLSLEYDSVWDTKPSWCQPWTITLTGVLVIAFSWLILHSVLATGVVVFLIGLWWYIFLYSYPKAYADMIAERRKRVSNGVEDTFGLGETR